MISFIEGLLLGYGYVMPIGAQNLYVIQSAINKPMTVALKVSGIVILLDISLALACFFGAGFVFSSHEMLAQVLQFFGGLYVIKIGATLLLSKPTSLKTEEESIQDSKSELRNVLRSAFVLTWLNPQAIVDGSILLGSMRSDLDFKNSLFFIIGVSSASVTWFLGLTLGIGIFKSKINLFYMYLINYTCGGVLIWFGSKLIFSSLGVKLI